MARPETCSQCVLGLWCISGAPITVEVCPECHKLYRMFPGDDQAGGSDRYARGIDPSKEICADCPNLQGKLAQNKNVILMGSSLCIACLEIKPRQSDYWTKRMAASPLIGPRRG